MQGMYKAKKTLSHHFMPGPGRTRSSIRSDFSANLTAITNPISNPLAPYPQACQ